MKRAFLLLSLLVIINASHAQNHAFEKGISSFSVGFGAGNIWKSFLDKVVTLPEYKVQNNGVFILIYEYGFTNRISTGLQASYSSVEGNYNSGAFSFHDRLNIFSILARGNYHFYKSSKFDGYLGGGLGINNSKYTNSESIDANEKEPNTFDFSGQVGIKYYPTRHFGFYSEVGYVGGSFLQIGIVGKF